ncbi:MAG TPA: YdiU family protein [Nitrosospira sp.]|nr:YdiU family protein [Nitrosospira sp.]
MSQSNLKRSSMMDSSTVPDTPSLQCLSGMRFDNRFVRRLPADEDIRNTPRPVKNACYTRVEPTPVRAPRLLAWSDAVGELLGVCRPAEAAGPVIEALAGNRILPGMEPYSARYGGHQFGHWAGQLGDGRAITLGEILCPDGIYRELQLKGAGRTPYSRTADGRAVLRSSVREFLCSEAMHHLGVPTTRALSLVATGESVVRDMFYDGNPKAENGAVVCRVAPSFVRFGNFEILAAQQEPETLRQLADYVITEHFPELGMPGSSMSSIHVRWFEEICRRTAVLLAHWMRVGFVHGVMNTDNMSILGLTIDYGPYGWLEGFDFNWTPNTTDAQGRRYCYGNQPDIALWNLTRLAGALAPLVSDHAELERGLAVFGEVFQNTWSHMLADKLGLATLGLEGDDVLLSDLFDLLQQSETDMTLFFRSLMDIPVDGTAGSMDDITLAGLLRNAFYDENQAFAPGQLARLSGWLRQYIARVRLEADAGPSADTSGMGACGATDRAERMRRANPKYVLRNYLAQQAIEALEQGDASVIERLMGVLKHPYDEQPEEEAFAGRRPEWARNKPGCSALSCSS